MLSISPSKRKWYIVATIFIAIICNYMDRQLLSILKPEILDHYGISDPQYAMIVNIFLLCYAIMYPLCGMLIDKFGPKKVMLAGIGVWSLACIGGGLAPNVTIFAICRGLLGIAEPTVFAGQIIAVTLWFEKKERATANSLCVIGGSLGAVVAPIVIAWLMDLFSYWQYVFIISGAIGLVITLIWQFIYITPPAEVLAKTVADDDAKSDSVPVSAKFSFKDLFKTKTLWGCLLIRLISDPVWYFTCFWLPGFIRNMGNAEGLSNEQTLSMIQWIGGIPFLVGGIGGILYSMWSDKLVKKGMDSIMSRKKILAFSAIFAPLCMLIPLVTGSEGMTFTMKIWSVIIIFSLVAATCLNWLYTLPVVIAEAFPIGNVATVMGVACGAGALGTIVFNQFVGNISAEAWNILFIIMGLLHLIATVVLYTMCRKEEVKA